MQLRLRMPLNEEEVVEANPRASTQQAPSEASRTERVSKAERSSKAGAAKASSPQVEEEDDFTFANRIVSYNVLQFEIERLKVRRHETSV